MRAWSAGAADAAVNPQTWMVNALAWSTGASEGTSDDLLQSTKSKGTAEMRPFLPQPPQSRELSPPPSALIAPSSGEISPSPAAQPARSSSSVSAAVSAVATGATADTASAPEDTEFSVTAALPAYSKLLAETRTLGDKAGVNSQTVGRGISLGAMLERPEDASTGSPEYSASANSNGPYAAATALLRTVLPHYNVTIWSRVNWKLVCVLALGFVGLGVYVGVRIWYLVSGRSAALNVATGNVSIWYSWLALVAELVMALVGMYSRLLTKRQTVKFAAVRDNSAWGITKVRLRCKHNVTCMPGGHLIRLEC